MRRSAVLLVAALSAVGVMPAAPAVAAARPTHVAIVIAGHGVACVAWHSGITGDEVLNTVATVKYRPSDGLITQIDGQPKNNRADTTHYWSYWHNTGSGWTYSTSGAGSYLPKAGSVEGWHFINGSSTATPPPVRTYASICHETTSVPPPATTPARASTSTSAHLAHSSTAGRSSVTADQPVASTSAASSAARLGTSDVAPGSPGSTAPAVGGAGSASPSVAALPSLAARNAADATHHLNGGSALPTVLVLVLVLVLGGTAALVAQRRRRST